MLTWTGLALAVWLVLAAPAAAFSPSDRITRNGLGGVEIGMTVRQVGAAVGRPLGVDRINGDGPGSCGSARLGAKIYGLFTGSILTRVYVNSSRYRTRKGVRVGSRASLVIARYGRALSSEPHFYVRGGRYLRVTTGRRRIVFETSAGGRVTSISVGRIPEVDYVEGCA